MKKLFSVFTVLLIFFPLLIIGQMYTPMVVEGANYVMIYGSEDYTQTDTYVLRIEGDTLISNKVYKKLYFISLSIANGGVSVGSPEIFGYLREDLSERKVFGFRENFTVLNFDLWFCPIFQEEQMLYDFSAVVGELAFNCNHDDMGTVEGISNQVEFGINRRVLLLERGDNRIIEGVGFNRGPFNSSIIHAGEGHYLDDYCVGDLDVCVNSYINSAQGSLVNPNYKWTHAFHDFFGGGGISSGWLGIGDEASYVYGNLAHQLIRSEGEMGTNWVIIANRWIRQEDAKVYHYENMSPTLLYDFSLEVGDTFDSYGGVLDVVSIDSIELINGEKRKSLILQCKNFPFNSYEWAEGVGDINQGLLSPLSYCSTDYNEELLCHFENDNLLYTNPRTNSCWLTGTRDTGYKSVDIYPNPVMDILTVDYKGSQNTRFAIYNMHGVKLNSGHMMNGGINIISLQPGMYYLQIEDKNSVLIATFVKA